MTPEEMEAIRERVEQGKSVFALGDRRALLAEVDRLRKGAGMLQSFCASLIRTLDNVAVPNDPEQKAAQAEAMANSHKLARMLGVE